MPKICPRIVNIFSTTLTSRKTKSIENTCSLLWNPSNTCLKKSYRYHVSDGLSRLPTPMSTEQFVMNLSQQICPLSLQPYMTAVPSHLKRTLCRPIGPKQSEVRMSRTDMCFPETCIHIRTKVIAMHMCTLAASRNPHIIPKRFGDTASTTIYT